MSHECTDCGEEFRTLSSLRMHDCPGPSSDDAWTVLNDSAFSDEPSHREMAEHILPRLKEEMPEQAYYSEFTIDLQHAIIESITQDLSANLKSEDWHSMGFEDPTDFLDAGSLSSTIGNQAQWYFEDDQTGKSHQVLQVILDYAKEYEIVTYQDT